MTGHPANAFDDLVHQRVRLGILAITHEARWGLRLSARQS
jgi:hypothetical protein